MISITPPFPAEQDAALQQQIAVILLSEPSIEDCALMFRQTLARRKDLVVYYVSQAPVNQALLHERIKALLPDAEQHVHFVPLYKLPLTSTGLIDYAALASVPVFEEGDIASGEQRLQREWGVAQLAIIPLQNQVVAEPRYHLSDLMPNALLSQNSSALQSDATPISTAAQQSATPAIINSGELNFPVSSNTTLLDIFQAAVNVHGQRTIRFVLADGEMKLSNYAELGHLSARIYAGLLAQGLVAGDKVVMLLRGNVDILASFWACQMGGFIPLIVELPTVFHDGQQALERVVGVMQLLNNPWVVADRASVPELEQVLQRRLNEKPRICSVEQLKLAEPVSSGAKPKADDVALYNLSSGSTGRPKCIKLTHRNLLARAQGANQLGGFASDDVILNWLPLDHIGSISDWHIRCVLLGCELTYVDKDYILGQPLNWLKLIDRFRVSHSWAPNFAFALINKQLETQANAMWDLSCVKCLLTAGEAVSDEASQRFGRLLAKYGLSPHAVQPAFGMAELGSGITYFVASEQHPLRFHALRHPALGQSIERLTDEDPAAARFADLGGIIPGVALRVVDNDNALLSMETVGHIQVKGEVVFQGYLDNPEANAAAFTADGWFKTGDLGFLSAGNLVLTGRAKETIIIKGANYYSHEIEEVVTQVAGVAVSYTVACGVRLSGDSEEKLALFFVLLPEQREEELLRLIRTQVANRFGITPTYLIPLAAEQIPKTSIGKIQRSQLKQRMENGEFAAVIQRVDLLLGNANTLPAWFYRSVWQPKQAQTADPRLMHNAIMLLMDEAGLGEALAAKFRAAPQTCVTVTPAAQFKCLDAYHFECDFQSEAQFLAVLGYLKQAHIGITQLVSLLDYGAVTELGYAVMPRLQVATWLNLAKALVQGELVDALRRVVWVASASQCVVSEDNASPTKAMMSAFSKVLGIEHPAIVAIHLDLDASSHAHNHHLLYDELTRFSKDSSVAFRDGQRYVTRLEPLNLLDRNAQQFAMQAGGLYLITGGLGGIGFELCRKLGRDAQILIIGRSALAGETKQRYQTLLDAQINCHYAEVDIGDAQAVTALVQQAELNSKRLLDGIFHLAGSAHACSLEHESFENFEAIVHPKSAGMQVLHELLTVRKRTLLVAFSSVNAFFGGAHTASYAAANSYLEAYCQQLRQAGYLAFCYAWSLWDGVGMSAQAVSKSAAAAKGLRAIALEEGLNSLFALLYAGQTEAIIGLDATKKPIQQLIANNCYAQATMLACVAASDKQALMGIPKSITLADCFGVAIACPVVPMATLPLMPTGMVDKEQLKTSLTYTQGQKAHTPPKNAVEAKLLELWRTLLPVDDISTEDNFFELGGDSLLAVQLVTMIASSLQQKIPTSAVFHAPTIRQLAETLQNDSLVPELFSLVPIKATGSKPPLFLVQSDSWELVRFLDDEQPVYGLNYGVGAKLPASQVELPGRLEDLAAHFVQEIQVVQPSGPYYILGHSNAGLLAYEIAQQLIAREQTIGLLGLIDTWHLAGLKQAELSLREKLRKLSALPFKKRMVVLRNWTSNHHKQIKLRLFANKDEIPFADRTMHLALNYVPRAYPGKLAYFKCVKESRLQPVGDHATIWGKLAQGINLHAIACEHKEVLTAPHVKILAEQIGGYLA